MKKTPYEQACEGITWGEDGMPDWVPVPLADDMTSHSLREGGRHCAYGISDAIRHVDPYGRFEFANDFAAAYRQANGTIVVSVHNDRLPTDAARAKAVAAAFREMGYDA